MDAVSQVFAFSQALVDKLEASVWQNMDWYVDARRPWVERVAEMNELNLPTPYSFEDVVQLKFKARKSKAQQDLASAKRLHRSLRLSRADASDPRLWTRLTHVEFWPYMRDRWPVKRGEIKFVLRRYFVHGHGSRALLRNGVARLWWLAELTYDPERENPYELTDVLFSDLDLVAQLTERNYGRAPKIMKGFLEFLAERRDLLLTGGDVNRRRLRQLAIHVNQIGGATLLDFMTKAELHQLLQDQLEVILQMEKREAGARTA